jgi:SAM-dependent methyltransferase
VWEIDSYFHGTPYKVLDIGCAGGQFAVDIYNKGFPYLAVGLEGGNILGMIESFEKREANGDYITEARGRSNWENYKDKCLFYADVSQPFKICEQGTDDIIRFDLVTSFEFFEHPDPAEIPGILRNINKHMLPGGITVGTINMTPGVHHRCAKSVEWWDSMFAEYGFERPADNLSRWDTLRELGGYPFRTSYRTGPQFYGQILAHNSDPDSQVAGVFEEPNKGLLCCETRLPTEENHAYLYQKVREVD